MIPSSRKFPLRTEFLAFRTKSKKISTSLFTVHLHPQGSELSGSSEPISARLSVIIPKKVNKLAVVRNWLRRLSYDTLWPLIKDKNLDVVIIYKPLLLTKSPQTKEKITSAIKNLEFNY